jgi:hypothetical protein
LLGFHFLVILSLSETRWLNLLRDYLSGVSNDVLIDLKFLVDLS